MNDSITIAGRSITVPVKYSEGHVLSANEASALNQVYHENIRNNTAKRVKEAESDEAAQSIVNEYVAGYEFGVRTGGGGSRDPVQTELMAIAREAVRKALQKKGFKLTGDEAVPAKKITELATDAVSKHPEWLDLAKARVAQQREIVSDLDLSAA